MMLGAMNAFSIARNQSVINSDPLGNVDDKNEGTDAESTQIGFAQSAFKTPSVLLISTSTSFRLPIVQQAAYTKNNVLTGTCRFVAAM